MKKLMALVFIFVCVLCLCLTACNKQKSWNGETECLGEVSMVLDFTNLYEYVGIVDHIFVGTVEEAEYYIPEKRTEYEQSFSKYQIRVDKNLKGELIETIRCSKMGGLIQDGTMLLIAAETPNGKMVMDSGLPEVGKQYVFLAYTQQDGSLTLSEILDNRKYNEDLLAEYMDYIGNEIPFERERFVSEYNKSAD